jgi:uncharacterized protein YndB with AHSA1/START domain
MAQDITCEATYPYSPAQVWQALTRSDVVASWLMDNTLGTPVVGHRFRFTDRPRPFWDGVCECEVVTAEPDRELALRWALREGDAASGSRVTWTLAPAADGGTKLSFRHAGLTGPLGWVMKQGMTKGWNRMVSRSLPFVLEQLAKGQVPTRSQVKAAVAAR